MLKLKSDFAKRFSPSTRRWTAALSAVVLLVLGAMWAVHRAQGSSERRAAVLKLSRQQETLLQSVSYYSESLSRARAGERDEVREKLMDFIDRFSAQQRALLSGNADVGAPTEAMKAIYFGSADRLDLDIQSLILSVHSLLRIEAEGGQRYAPVLYRIRDLQQKIFPKLNRIANVSRLELEMELKDLRTLKALLLVDLGLVLLVALLFGCRLLAMHFAPPSPPKTDNEIPPPTNLSWGSGLNVLLVDDNAVNQKIIATQLARFGFHVEWVETGRDAIQAASKASFDLVLMDCEMPEMDGFEVSREIRRIECDKNVNPVPILAMTGQPAHDIRQKCLESGMSAFVTKPIRRESLSSTLQEWLRIDS